MSSPFLVKDATISLSNTLKPDAQVARIRDLWINNISRVSERFFKFVENSRGRPSRGKSPVLPQNGVSDQDPVGKVVENVTQPQR